MGKYYEFAKIALALNGVNYTVSQTVTRKEDENGKRAPIMIVFRKGHKGGAFRTYNADLESTAEGSVLDFIAKNSLISDDDWKARTKTNQPKSAPIQPMVEADLMGAETSTENKEIGELSDEPTEQASDESVAESEEVVNTTDKLIRDEKGRLRRNPNYVAPAETVEESAAA